MLPLLYYIIDYYKPKGRSHHSSVVIGNKLYNWGGNQDGLPKVHSSEEKRKFLSNINVLHLETGIWHNKPTAGDPHPGVIGYACTAIEKNVSSSFLVATVAMLAVVITTYHNWTLTLLYGVTQLEVIINVIDL